MATQQYASSAGKLSEKKWQKIYSLVKALLADADDQDALQSGSSGSMDPFNEDYLMAARAEIEVSDSDDEVGESFAGEED